MFAVRCTGGSGRAGALQGSSSLQAVEALGELLGVLG